MYKYIALIALLLPFSGYAITKQERKKELEVQIEKVMGELVELQIACCASLPFIFFTLTQQEAEKINQEVEVKKQELDRLTNEYQQL